MNFRVQNPGADPAPGLAGFDNLSIGETSYWCPTAREDNISTPPDLVGVYVRTRHVYMTGFIGDETVLEETTVIRIEPEAE